jgi:splicing factor 3A subunit 2
VILSILFIVDSCSPENPPLGKVAAEPYETIAFRVPSREIESEVDDDPTYNWSHWDPDTKQYFFQFMFR